MRLNQYVAERRLAVFEDLKSGHPPREGAYDEALLKEALAKGHPQMGSSHFEPHTICLEYIFPDPLGAPIVLPVRLAAPERIVFLPVPDWVVENIWQGEIDGTYQFETDAHTMLDRFRECLTPAQNPSFFEAKQAVGKA